MSPPGLPPSGAQPGPDPFPPPPRVTVEESPDVTVIDGAFAAPPAPPPPPEIPPPPPPPRTIAVSVQFDPPVTVKTLCGLGVDGVNS